MHPAGAAAGSRCCTTGRGRRAQKRRRKAAEARRSGLTKSSLRRPAAASAMTVAAWPGPPPPAPERVAARTCASAPPPETHTRKRQPPTHKARHLQAALVQSVRGTRGTARRARNPPQWAQDLSPSSAPKTRRQNAPPPPPHKYPRVWREGHQTWRSGGRAASCSVMRATSGDTTRVRPGSASAGSWPTKTTARPATVRRHSANT